MPEQIIVRDDGVPQFAGGAELPVRKLLDNLESRLWNYGRSPECRNEGHIWNTFSHRRANFSLDEVVMKNNASLDQYTPRLSVRFVVGTLGSGTFRTA